ncbi:MAG: ABC transporter ATP-binding protein [Actinobacteria bacterium]|nr:ABC transporter ATP-binding protein [Actinomycetota bacterium]
MSGGEPLLEVDGLEVTYQKGDLSHVALQDMSLQVRAGEILGIVGESGCGKSTLSAAVMRLLAANGAITAGSIRLKGQELRSLQPAQLRQIRGREIAMIFQDPLTSLNPTFRIGTQLVDAQKAHTSRRSRRGLDRELRRRAIDMLTQVGIPDAQERVDHFPHEFSGGMRQRIMIALALLLEPALLIADEPTSALDVTLQAQILELLSRLRTERGTAIMFISHDLGVVSQLCDRVVVMYAGQPVEEGDVASVFERPLHPYTQALLGAIPSRKRRGAALVTIPGRVPSLADLPQGCRFADRCQFVQDVNRGAAPRYVGVDGRRVRCNIYDPESGYRPAAAVQESIS